MNRKIIKQGLGGYTITLPKEWVRENNIEQQNEVDVLIDGQRLVIAPIKNKTQKELFLKLSSEHPKVQRFVLSNAYRLGYEKIIVELSSDKQLVQIQELLQQLMGLEITEQHGNRLILKSIALPDPAEYDALFRRGLHILTTAFAYLVDDKSQEIMDLPKIDSLLNNSLRISNYCKRILHVNPPASRSDCYSQDVILTLMDYSISQLKCAYLCKEKLDQQTQKFLQLNQELLLLVIEVYINKDPKQLIAMIELRDKILEQKNKFIPKNSFQMEVILLSRILTFYVGPLSLRVYSKNKLN